MAKKQDALKSIDWLKNYPGFAELFDLLAITGGNINDYLTGTKEDYKANPASYVKIDGGKNGKYLDLTKMFSDKPKLAQAAFQKNYETVKSTPAYSLLKNESEGNYPTEFLNAVNNKFTDTGAKIAGQYAGQGTLKDNIGKLVADVTANKQDYFYNMQKAAQGQLFNLANQLQPATGNQLANPFTQNIEWIKNFNFLKNQNQFAQNQQSWSSWSGALGGILGAWSGDPSPKDSSSSQANIASQDNGNGSNWNY